MHARARRPKKRHENELHFFTKVDDPLCGHRDGAKVGYAKVRKRFKTITPKKCQGQSPGGQQESTVTRGNVARTVCGCGLRASLVVRHGPPKVA